MRRYMTAMVVILVLLSGLVARGQTPDTGRQVFVSRCAGCHGTDGNGGELGPAITTRVPARTDADLSALFAQGLPASGMPSFANFSTEETADVIHYLRTLRPRSEEHTSELQSHSDL